MISEEYVRSLKMCSVTGRRVGKWVDTNKYCGFWECNECGWYNDYEKFKYCPNCGADMRGEKNEDSD